MIEGIIQEVISKERQDLEEFKSEIYDTQQRELCDLFDKYLRNIQQELIEKIKQEYGETQHGIFIIRLEKLIGDNNE